MRFVPLALAVALAAPLAAAQTEPRQEPSRPLAQQPSAGRTAATVAPDRDFARRTAEAGAAEIAAGKLAMDKARSDAVREFGRRMVEDHQAADAKLAEIAKAKNMLLPTTPDRAHEEELKKLGTLSGAAFDREYMRSQVKDHRQVIGMFERQAASGQDLELKRLAAETLPKLREHLAMAQRAEAGQASDHRGMGDRGSRTSAASSDATQGSDARERSRTQELNREALQRAQRSP